MRLSNVFDSMEKENRFLRTTTKLLVVAMAGLGSGVIMMSDRQPIIVERTSRGLEVVRQTAFIRTQEDLKIAINWMIKVRFSTVAVSPEIFLNPKQQVLRETEQKEMKARNMTQAVVVRNITADKEQALVDFDRVISVGDVRSALKTRVRVAFEETSPNELNPYGLLLSLADPVDKMEVKK